MGVRSSGRRRMSRLMRIMPIMCARFLRKMGTRECPSSMISCMVSTSSIRDSSSMNTSCKGVRIMAAVLSRRSSAPLTMAASSCVSVDPECACPAASSSPRCCPPFVVAGPLTVVWMFTSSLSSALR
eukprot:Amastigsp_a1935_20.p3 type:complete len:127 gc:universal Amastigsp_a1935_20:1076-696(-)